MSASSNVAALYASLPERPVDEQIVLLCDVAHNGVIRLEVVLAQYKFCINHGIAGHDFDTLKRYLESMLTETDVKMLEALYEQHD